MYTSTIPTVAGPAIVDDVTPTILVPAGWRAEVDGHENLIIRRT